MYSSLGNKSETPSQKKIIIIKEKDICFFYQILVFSIYLKGNENAENGTLGLDDVGEIVCVGLFWFLFPICVFSPAFDLCKLTTLPRNGQ